MSRRVSVLLFVSVCAVLPALAQKGEVAFTLGAAMAGDGTGTSGRCLVPACSVSGPTVILQTNRNVAFEGIGALRLANLKVMSFHLELPVAVVPSTPYTLSNSALVDHVSSLFVTPGLKVRILPGSAISPFVSAGGGMAHNATMANSDFKGAFAFGGGVDFKTRLPILAFRTEVRDFVTGAVNPSFAATVIDHARHTVLASGGVVLKF
jgi:hypothetical protein